mgnify:CR=1 FL=1
MTTITTPDAAIGAAIQTIHLFWCANLYDELRGTLPPGPVENWAPSLDPKVGIWLAYKLRAQRPYMPADAHPETWGRDLAHKVLATGGGSGEYERDLKNVERFLEFVGGYELLRGRRIVTAANGQCASSPNFGPKLRRALVR